MKKCTKCGETKDLTEFYKDKSKKDGRCWKCKACEAERAKQYYQENREKCLEQRKQYYQANPEKIAEQQKQYYQANREKIRQYRQENREKIVQYNKQYRQANPEKIKQYNQAYSEKKKAHNQKRRARKRNAAGNATAADIQARFDYHDNRCYYCGCDGKMTIEHRIPLSRGGTHHPANIVPACQSCNSSKGAKTESEFVV